MYSKAYRPVKGHNTAIKTANTVPSPSSFKPNEAPSDIMNSVKSFTGGKNARPKIINEFIISELSTTKFLTVRESNLIVKIKAEANAGTIIGNNNNVSFI